MIRESSVPLFCLQGRRIECGRCGEPFTYLVEHEGTVTVHDIAIVNASASLQDSLVKGANKWLRKATGKSRAGEARCPHCRRYQGWMVFRSRFGKLLWWGLPTLVVSPCVVGPFTGLFHENPNLVAFFAVLVVLLAGALFVGWKLALPTEPAREEFDARAATDEELERLFHICAATDGDALMEWYLSFHMEMPEKKFLVRGGFRDEVGGDLVPKDATTEAVLAEK